MMPHKGKDMSEQFQRTVEKAYRVWKKGTCSHSQKRHLDEETLAGFIEGTIAGTRQKAVLRHLIGCQECLAVWRVTAGTGSIPFVEVPRALQHRINELLVKEGSCADLFEIVVRLKDRCVEMVHTSGDVLVGQEVIPGVLMRTRASREFQGECTVMKDFPKVRVTLTCEPKPGGVFNLTVIVKRKGRGTTLAQARISLFREEVELESYRTRQGVAVFEHLHSGRYRIDVSLAQQVVATAALEVGV